MTIAGRHQGKHRKAGAEAWWTLAVLCFFYMLSFLDRHILSMLVGPIQADLGLTDFEIGLALGPAFGLGLGLLALPFGWLADRSPRRAIVFWGVCFWSVATAACGLVSSGLTLFMARFGVGIGEAALAPAATSLLADKFPRDRLTTAVGIYQSANKLGSAAAFGLGGLLIALLSGMVLDMPFFGQLGHWQLVFLAVGLPGSLFALLTFTFSEPPRLGRRSAEPPRLRMLWAFLVENRSLMLPMYAGFALVAVVGYALTAWVPVFIERRYGLSPVQFGPALSVISLAAAATLVLKGAIVDWLYARGHRDAHLRFYSWLLLGTTPVGIYIFFSPNAWLFLALYGVLMAVTIPSMIYLSASQALLAPNELRGQLSALASTVYAILGIGLGPALVGAITDFVFHDQQKIGLSMALMLTIGMPGGALLLRLAMKPLNAAVAAAEALERNPVEAAISTTERTHSS